MSDIEISESYPKGEEIYPIQKTKTKKPSSVSNAEKARQVKAANAEKRRIEREKNELKRLQKKKIERLKKESKKYVSSESEESDDSEEEIIVYAPSKKKTERVKTSKHEQELLDEINKLKLQMENMNKPIKPAVDHNNDLTNHLRKKILNF